MKKEYINLYKDIWKALQSNSKQDGNDFYLRNFAKLVQPATHLIEKLESIKNNKDENTKDIKEMIGNLKAFIEIYGELQKKMRRKA